MKEPLETRLHEVIGQLDDVADEICGQMDVGPGDRFRSYAVTALNEAIESVGAVIVLMRETEASEQTSGATAPENASGENGAN